MNKKTIAGIAALALAGIAALWMCLSAIARTAYGGYNALRVVIDAGHGGIDGGVSGVTTGTKESDINLEIALFLQEELEDAGVEVTLTRKTQAGLYGTTARYFKRRDMEKRREIIEKTAPHAVVSVHQNFFADRSKRGATVFFRRGDGSGEVLAMAIQSQFNGFEGTPSARTPLIGDYYMLNCTAYPSVIVECGFLSNPDDEALAVSEAYRRTAAERIARGVLSFLAKNVSS